MAAINDRLVLLLLGSVFCIVQSSDEKFETSAKCAQSDLDGLLSFKSLIVEDRSEILKSWSGDACCAAWEGVECDSKTNRVVKLELQNRAEWNETIVMRGTLSPSLAKLEFLEVLVVNGFREIKGSIPSSIGNLRRLKQLYLENNKLTGIIPPSIGKLTQLQTLSLNGNRFVGPIPDGIGELRQLIQINLAKNRLNGSIPVTVQNLPSLQFFDLNDNLISGPLPPFLGSLQSLTFLDFSRNNLSGKIPAALGNLSNAMTLSLAGNQLTGKIPSTLARLASLSSLSLNENFLDGTIPESLSNMSKLWYMNLSRNFLSDPLPASLANASALLSLDLSHNKFNLGRIPAWIASKEMTDVHLAGCGIAGRLADWKPSATSMFTSIDLSDNSLTGEIGAVFANMSRLERIFLSNNYLKSNLSEMSFPEVIGAVDLHSNQLYGSIRKILYDISGACSSPGGCLDYLDLSDNLISGTIPDLVDGERRLKFLDLSNNALSGSIPWSILMLSSVRRLDLSGNRLEGKVPASIGRLRELAWLDLSRNGFTGGLPVELLGLNNLKHVNFRYNHLCGEIPQGKTLTVFPVSAFLHNDCLCGTPLALCKKA
ncbi:hypothetical protein KI387_005555 [Taxus chinensis]|uniref:Leucine-rich repeat-containing N-terminal plant-type domain-containing protein n=1 Tax=Taxus chinensis TaxID=29808 RepID=A0AA38GKM6_TAXCH|nr:hypothetical protein KI387_005555 [Taxus chinensis]